MGGSNNGRSDIRLHGRSYGGGSDMGVMEPRWRVAEKQIEALQSQIDTLTKRVEAAEAKLKPEGRIEAVHPKVKNIIETVSGFFDIPVSEIKGRRRKAQVVEARHVAMWAARHATEFTYPRIARQFRLDHTTIMHGIKNIDTRRKTDPEFREKTDKVLEWCKR